MLNFIFLISSLLVRLSVFSPFIVDGPSMQPTLHSGDLFILNQQAYVNSEPHRGDIVVFSNEKEPDYFYVKRIIGLPGERLHITSNGIYVETSGARRELAEPYLAHAAENKDYSLKGYKDELFVIPKDKYFVLGDNRPHSLDSRSFVYPFIPKAGIKGKYIFTLLDL